MASILREGRAKVAVVTKLESHLNQLAAVLNSGGGVLGHSLARGEGGVDLTGRSGARPWGVARRRRSHDDVACTCVALKGQVGEREVRDANFVQTVAGLDVHSGGNDA